MPPDETQVRNVRTASLNIHEKVMADPTLHFLAMNRASRQYHPREMAVAGPQHPRLYYPLVHNTRQHLASTPPTLYPVQYQQRMDCHPKVRPNISQGAQYHQQTTTIHPQVRPNTWQAALYHGQRYFHPPLLPNTSQAAQYQQQTGLPPQVQPNTSQAPQCHQQTDSHPSLQHNISQASNTSYSSQVDQSVLYECSHDVSSRSVHAPRLEHTESRDEPRVGNPTHPFPAQITSDSSSSNICTSLGSYGGYAVDHDSLPKIVAVHSAGVYNKDDVSTPSSSIRYTQQETLQDSSDDIRTKVSFQGREASISVPAEVFSSLWGKSVKKLCTEERRSSPQIDRLSDAQESGTSQSIQTEGPGKDDVSTPRSAIRCTQEETLQDSSDDIIITKVSFQGHAASISAPVKGCSPVHVASESRKLCTEERRSSPQIDRPPDAQASGTSQTIQTEGPGKDDVSTPRSAIRCTQQEMLQDSSDDIVRTKGLRTKESLFILWKNRFFPSQTQEITGDASRETFANKQPPLPVPNGYLNVQDFFESHTQTASTKDQETPTLSTVSDIELEFGGPPPYLPLCEPCGETAHNAYESRPSGASPKQHNEDESSFTSNNKELGASRLNSSRSVSQDQEMSQKPKDLVSSEFTQWNRETHSSIEDHLESARGKNDEVPLSAKLPKKSYTLELLCSKILQTQERIKNEEIDWKRKVLHRLETMFIKKLLRMERETGKKADIDIPREDPPKKKVKHRN